MDIRISASDFDDSLEAYREGVEDSAWELVASGSWYGSRYHSGHVAYYILKTSEGIWLLDRVERNECLDGVTEGDVESGALNDDQIQAMWGMTLEEAQNQSYKKIVAICETAKQEDDFKKMAEILYEEVGKSSSKIVEEPDCDGLLDI